MISAVRTNNRSRGFTLLEIVIVLAIAAMVMGGAAGFMVYSSDERALRDVSGQIELLAKRARTTSILQQTPYALEFRPGIVRMLPLAEAGEIDKKYGKKQNLTASVDEDRQVNIRDEMSLSIRRWNSDKWLSVGKNSIHIWRFDPDGLCEPVSLRLSLDKSWMEDSYHPLTATIRDTQLEAR
ncbi:MAG: prepilin-type N-terminal cleavage/methylation domain-containing protein [Luteolibacter sp.]